MEVNSWLDLCYQALGVPADVPEQERRRLAEHALLETTGQPVDILGIGAAEAAIDLVVRYGEAGELDQVLLRWEQAECLAPGVPALADERTRRATACAKKLLQEVVAWADRGSDPAGPGGRRATAS